MNDLMLIPNPDLRSEAMVKAAELRQEGMDASTALSLAWDEVKDNLDEEEDWDNPMELTRAPKRRVKTNADDESIGGIGLVLLGVGGWLAYYFWKNKRFPWQPAPTVTQRMPMPGMREMTPVISRPGVGESRFVPNQPGRGVVTSQVGDSRLVFPGTSDGVVINVT